MTTSIGEVRYRSPKEVSKAWLQAEYDRQADSWDQTLDRFSFPDAYRRLLEEERWRNPGRSVSVLDLGVGSGATSLAMIGALRKQGILVSELTGVDISARMLDKAKEKALSSGIAFRAIQADTECLPFESGSFDFVIGAHVLEHLPRPLRAMAEVERLLTPGGSAIFMMTRCAPITVSIQKRWFVQCVRSKKLEAVLKDFGMENVRCTAYPWNLVANLLSFCCIAEKPGEVSE